jgi:hypothetical protein
MVPSASSPRQSYSRPLARLAAVATLAAFLVAQSWIVCAPLCLLEGHARVAMAASAGQAHTEHCHSHNVMSTELPTIQLGSMVPVSLAQLLPAPRVVTIRFAPPASVQLQQIPPAEPPPPRSV